MSAELVDNSSTKSSHPASSSTIAPLVPRYDILADGESDDEEEVYSELDRGEDPRHDQIDKDQESAFSDILEEKLKEKEEGEGDERNDTQTVSSNSSSAHAIEPSIELQEREKNLTGADNTSFAIGALPNVDYSLPPKVMYFAVKNSGKLSLQDASYIILRETRVAMNAKEIWDIASRRNWSHSKANPTAAQGPSTILLNALNTAASKPNSVFVPYADKLFGLSELLPYQAFGQSDGKGTSIISAAPPLPPLCPIFVWPDSSPQLIATATKLQSDFNFRVRGRPRKSKQPADSEPQQRKPRPLSSGSSAANDRKRKVESFSSDENTFRLAINSSNGSASSSSCDSQVFGSNLVETLLDSAEQELKSKNWTQALEGFQAKRRALSSLGEPELCVPLTEKDGKVIRYEFYVKRCEL